MANSFTTFTPYIPALGGEGTGSENSSFQNSYINSSGSNIGGTYCGSCSSSGNTYFHKPTVSQNVSNANQSMPAMSAVAQDNDYGWVISNDTSPSNKETTLTISDDYSWMDEAPTIDPAEGIHTTDLGLLSLTGSLKNRKNQRDDIDKVLKSGYFEDEGNPAELRKDMKTYLENVYNDDTADASKLPDVLSVIDNWDTTNKQLNNKAGKEFAEGLNRNEIAKKQEAEDKIADIQKQIKSLSKSLDTGVSKIGGKSVEEEIAELTKQLSEENDKKVEAERKIATNNESIKIFTDAENRLKNSLHPEIDDIELSNYIREQNKNYEEAKAKAAEEAKAKAEEAPTEDRTAEIEREIADYEKELETASYGESIEIEREIDELKKELTSEANPTSEATNELDSLIEEGKKDGFKNYSQEQVEDYQKRSEKATQKALEENNKKIEALVKELVGENKSFRDIKEELHNIETKSGKAYQNLMSEQYAIAQKGFETATNIQGWMVDHQIASYDKNGKYKGISYKELKKGSKELAEISPDAQTLTKQQMKALSKFANSPEAYKDTMWSIMQVSALSGAKDTVLTLPDGSISNVEKFKNSPAAAKNNGLLTKNTDSVYSWKDWVGGIVKGTGALALGALGGLALTNPATAPIGIALLGAGIKGSSDAFLGVASQKWRAEHTNYELMFGAEGDTFGEGVRQTYNSYLNPDTMASEKAVSHYLAPVKIAGGFAQIATGLATGNTGLVIAGASELGKVVPNLKNPLDEAIKQSYDMIKNAVDAGLVSPDYLTNVVSNTHASLGNSSTSSTTAGSTNPFLNFLPANSIANANQINAASAKSANASRINENLATDYNAGMEQETNEAVSSKYVKIFKTMLDNEPDYIRKVLIAIPKIHCEKEW